MASNRTAAQILAEWHACNNTCPPRVECKHHGPMATDEPDCAECWLAAAEKRAKASEEGAECMTDLLMLETPLSERDVAALHAWQAQQSRRVAEAEAGHATCRAEAARLMDLLIEAQADGNHLRRALEWAAVRDRVGVRTALAATEEAATA